MLPLKLTQDGRVDYIDPRIEEWRAKQLYHHIHGLTQTASGYGERLSTVWQVRIGSRWHRVYVAQFSNVGTCYVILQGMRHAVNESFPEAGLTAKGLQSRTEPAIA